MGISILLWAGKRHAQNGCNDLTLRRLTLSQTLVSWTWSLSKKSNTGITGVHGSEGQVSKELPGLKKFVKLCGEQLKNLSKLKNTISGTKHQSICSIGWPDRKQKSKGFLWSSRSNGKKTSLKRSFKASNCLIEIKKK